MLLRVSGKMQGASYDLELVGGRTETDGGVEHGRLMVQLTEAVIRGTGQERLAAREALAEAAGPEALVEAAATIAIFHCNVRVADATGIPLDEENAEPRRQLGRQLMGSQPQN